MKKEPEEGQRASGFRRCLQSPWTSIALVSVVLAALGCENAASRDSPGATDLREESLRHPEEVHLRNVRQLTFEGENAEAYFSGDGRQLIFQSTHGDLPCDQIFTVNVDGSGKKMVSTGKGRTTCAYFFPDGSRIVYASTHLGSPDCPPPPPRGQTYVWAVYKSYDIFSAQPDGSDLKRLTESPGYDAEATISPDGSRIVFTSARDGDLEIYSMNRDGSGQRRLTHTVGYDGGPFYSPDGKLICFRASRPENEEEKSKYLGLLADGLVEPSRLEIFVMDADGGNVRQVTDNGAANFCPFFHPSGRKIIYASNKDDPQKRNFDLYLVDIVTRDDERVTFHPKFDGFPMFSPDGKKIAWGSNRNNRKPRETNVFIADWVE